MRVRLNTSGVNVSNYQIQPKSVLNQFCAGKPFLVLKLGHRRFLGSLKFLKKKGFHAATSIHSTTLKMLNRCNRYAPYGMQESNGSVVIVQHAGRNRTHNPNVMSPYA